MALPCSGGPYRPGAGGSTRETGLGRDAQAVAVSRVQEPGEGVVDQPDQQAHCRKPTHARAMLAAFSVFARFLFLFLFVFVFLSFFRIAFSSLLSCLSFQFSLLDSLDQTDNQDDSVSKTK